MALHRLFFELFFLSSFTFLANSAELPLNENEGKISNDVDLVVALDPLIRVNLFETAENLSPGGVEAFLNAMNNYATQRMKTYFTNTYGTNEYIFESVTFEALEVSPVVGTRRKLRVFEREEESIIQNYVIEEMDGQELEDYRRSENSVSASAEEARDLQQVFGTSFLLGGNFTFESLPAAPSKECNRKLGKHMTKYYPMSEAIKSVDHAELKPRQSLPLETVFVNLTASPSLNPTPAPTTLSPTKSPTFPPTKQPTPAPAIPGPAPSMAPIYTTPPSNAPRNQTSGLVTDNDQADTANGNLSIIIPVLSAAAIIGIAAIFFIRRRHNSSQLTRDMTLLHHDKLREDDSDFESGGSPDKLIHVASTKDTGDSDSLDHMESGRGSSMDNMLDPVESMRSPTKESSNEYNSLSTSETMKTGNLIKAEQENKWRNSARLTPNRLPKKPLSPKLTSENVTFPVSIGNDDSKSSVESPLFGDNPPNSSISSEHTPSPPKHLETVNPVATGSAGKALFYKNRRGGASVSPKSRSMSKRRTASPIIDVSPSKVSKEEFEKDWDVDLPFNWNPTPASSGRKKKKNGKDSHNKSSSDNEVEGSFPTFEMTEDPISPVSPLRRHARSNSNNSSTLGSSTNAGSSYHSVNDIHPLDWSKVSDSDGVSGGDSSLSENDPQGNEWEGRLNARAGRSPILVNDARNVTSNTNYLTPSSHLTEHLNRTHPDSGYASSSVSSRGSSKQLINDIVWLEKKIADVRKRVDRLDGDGSHTTGSPPRSPDAINRSTSSPITADIICQDVIAPPGKLQIVIHSTKEPAIHSIKPGSVVEGKLFRGDLILSVNETDCRNVTAEEVMEMMARHSDSERKLTVLHAPFHSLL